MFKNLFFYVKYPSTSLIISTIWVGTAILIIRDPTLPVLKMVVIDLLVSFLIGYIGFRAESR